MTEVRILHQSFVMNIPKSTVVLRLIIYKMEAPLGLEIPVWPNLGGYLLFVDSDDWLESDALKIYADTLVKYNPEIIKSGYEVDYVNGHKVIHRCNKEALLNDKTQIFINTEDAGYAGFLWDSLFSRKIVGSTRFKESLKWLEDHLFSFELFARCNNLVMLPTVTYHYTINPGQSLSNVKDAQMVYDASQQEYQLKKM
jgi:hypothetical protein